MEDQSGLRFSKLESQALILFMEANYHPPRCYSQQLLDVFQRFKIIFLPSLFLTIREPEYYDYGHGESTESYESYGKKLSSLSTKMTSFILLIKKMLNTQGVHINDKKTS